MAMTATLGQAHALDGREASAQAVRQALDPLERQPIALAFVFASYEYGIQTILNGASAVLGEVPLMGFSTSGTLPWAGGRQRAVTVALLAGRDLQVQADWWPDIRLIEDDLLYQLEVPESPAESPSLFVVADGLRGDYEHLIRSLPAAECILGGGLASGDLHRGQTYQLGGTQAGSGGLAAAALQGAVRVGVGVAHGWRPVGAHFQVTLAQGPWVRALDGRPASEAYARLFGYDPREWAFPPLNELIRLYPLGVEGDGSASLQVRSPLRVEADGSLRMSTPVPQGSTCHLLVGSVEACQQAARAACQTALEALGDARPILAVALADRSWQMLFEAQPGREIEPLREILGPDVPIAGGYTFGQIAASPASGKPELLNQHMEVVVFGEVQGG